MTSALLLAAILSVADPAGDATGNGTVTMPSAVVFRSPGAFDARHIEVLETADFAFAMSFDQLSNPWGLEHGFSLPIIEVYLDGGDEGNVELLPGSGMRLAAGADWDYAFRMTGDRFAVYRALGDGQVREVTQELGASLSVEGNTLTVRTELPRPRRFSLYAMVGSYDPFSETGWRPIQREPGPWSLSSHDQNVPVLDVLAERASTQERAVTTGLLPEIRASVQYSGWLVVTVAGALLGLLGVAGRIAGPSLFPSLRTRLASALDRAPALLRGLPGALLALAARARRTPRPETADSESPVTPAASDDLKPMSPPQRDAEDDSEPAGELKPGSGTPGPDSGQPGSGSAGLEDHGVEEHRVEERRVEAAEAMNSEPTSDPTRSAWPDAVFASAESEQDRTDVFLRQEFGDSRHEDWEGAGSEESESIEPRDGV